MKVPEKEVSSLTSSITQLLSALSDSVPLTQCFKSKWSIIASKLSTLQSLVQDLSGSYSVLTTAAVTTSSLFLDLLQSLHATLTDALSLCTLCHAPTPPHGKLQTQNEVDSVAAKLDYHIKDLDVLIKSGVLLNQNAFAAATAPPATRESVRAEFRNLITRLQIGSSESKNSAMDSVLSLLNEDDKNVLIAVAQGIVPVLVRVLDSSAHHHLEMKEKIVTAIAKISMVDSIKHVLIAEGLGILNNLLRLLESGSVFAKERACIVLQVLSQSKENTRAIASRGGISSLLEICNNGTPNTQAMAAGVLRTLSVFPEIKDYFTEENAVIILLAVLNSGTTLAQENAIGCLNNLVNGDQNMKLLIAREGVIESLKNYWDSVSSVQNLEVAIVMVQILSSCLLIVEIVVENGFINRVAGVLNCGVLGVRVAAAKAVYELAYNTKSRKELGELGCLSALVRMLDGKAVEEKEAAAKALSNLLVYSGNRRIFRKEEKGVASAVQLLDPLVQNLDKKYPVSILNSLVHSKKCRKQLVSSGARSHLQKLVETNNNNVEGAKKLLDNLARGKIWGVFGRH